LEFGPALPRPASWARSPSPFTPRPPPVPLGRAQAAASRPSFARAQPFSAPCRWRVGPTSQCPSPFPSSSSSSFQTRTPPSSLYPIRWSESSSNLPPFLTYRRLRAIKRSPRTLPPSFQPFGAAVAV
jgi:hypothetical protein